MLVAMAGRPRSFDRDAALAVAVEEFWRAGYEETSVATLTAAMGVTPPSLYAAFGSKEGLYREAIEHYGQIHQEKFWSVMSAPTARESIEGLLRNAARAFTECDAGGGCLVMQSAAEIWRWLQDGAHFYVCGDAKRMAKDVDEALKAIAAQEGKMTPEQAKAFVGELTKAKRYQRDVY